MPPFVVFASINPFTRRIGNIHPLNNSQFN